MAQRTFKKEEKKGVGRMMSDQSECIAALEKAFGVEFKDRNLAIQAITHRSYLNENHSHPTGHNERLEFLGDAVVEIVVTETLYRRYPDVPEGTLTEYRSALVCGESLAALWESLGLWDALLLSKGESRSSDKGMKSRKFICANAFEAVMGAIYLDKGLGECQLVLDHILHRRMKEIIANDRDFKSRFQEDAQARFGLTPHYRVLKQSGPDHNKIFHVGCYLGKELISETDGNSKREAETAAAELAIETTNEWEGRIAESLGKASVVRRSKNGDRQ